MRLIFLWSVEIMWAICWVVKDQEVDAELFGDIGLFKCAQVKIQLDETAEPNCLTQQEELPFPFCQKRKKSLSGWKKLILSKE